MHYIISSAYNYSKIINLMKSISIVYKRPKTLRDPSTKKQEKQDLKTTVQKYYSKIVRQHDINREQLMQKIRSQTARATKKIDRRNVVSSLSIASLSTPQPTSLFKSNTQRKLPISSIFHIRKPKQDNAFTFNLPENSHGHQEKMFIESGVMRKNSKDLARHAKLKTLYRIKCEKPVTLVISVDFIFDQLNFWGQEEIQEGGLKTWKLLLPLANIIWLVRSESTSRKILAFTQSKGLRLDGIIQIEPSKKQSLTVTYSSLQQQAKMNRGHKLLIVNCLRCDIEPSQKLSQYQFRNSLPIISHPTTFIHFVQIDIKNKHRFSAVKKVVTQQLPKPFNIDQILSQHREKKGRYLSNCKIKDSCIETLEKTGVTHVGERLQQIKDELLIYFDQSFGLRTRLQGDSLTYVIGDMIRRNYSIAKQYYSYCWEIQQKQHAKEEPIMRSMVGNIKIQYSRPVYLWLS